MERRRSTNISQTNQEEQESNSADYALISKREQKHNILIHQNSDENDDPTVTEDG